MLKTNFAKKNEIIGKADLHIHSNISDGSDSPAQLVKAAHELGLRAISITDHDAISGSVDAIEIARQVGIEAIDGVEFSTNYRGTDIHIIGYLFSRRELIEQVVGELQRLRAVRAEKIVRRLARLGVSITMDDVYEWASGGSIGRPHIAAAMIAKSDIPNVRYAFKYYLGDGRAAYVPRAKLSPFEAVQLILAAGGIPVLSHPGLTNRDDLIPELVAWGLRGIEAFYPLHNERQIRKYCKIAEDEFLIVTGGSDYHGHPRVDIPMGAAVVEYEAIERMREEAERVRRIEIPPPNIRLSDE